MQHWKIVKDIREQLFPRWQRRLWRWQGVMWMPSNVKGTLGNIEQCWKNYVWFIDTKIMFPFKIDATLEKNAFKNVMMVLDICFNFKLAWSSNTYKVYQYSISSASIHLLKKNCKQVFWCPLLANFKSTSCQFEHSHILSSSCLWSTWGYCKSTQ
jgi:hypothetical protein